MLSSLMRAGGWALQRLAERARPLGSALPGSPDALEQGAAAQGLPKRQQDRGSKRRPQPPVVLEASPALQHSAVLWREGNQRPQPTIILEARPAL